MKFLLTILILVTIWTQAEAGEKHSTPAPPPVITTTTSTPTTLNLPSGNTYGLLGLAANNQFDWGVPEKLQVGVTMAFTEGGNQAIAVGAATRVGGIMVHGQFVSTIDGPDTEDDYAVIVGGTMHF